MPTLTTSVVGVGISLMIHACDLHPSRPVISIKEKRLPHGNRFR
nr:MAG TPA: hypothetical protein [Caudoviricetes sp.]